MFLSFGFWATAGGLQGPFPLSASAGLQSWEGGLTRLLLGRPLRRDQASQDWNSWGSGVSQGAAPWKDPFWLCAQRSLLVALEGLYRVPGMEPWSAACKGNALPTVLWLWPRG